MWAVDVRLHWHDTWPAFLTPLLSALESLPEAEEAGEGTVVLCPDAAALTPPDAAEGALVAFVPAANLALDPRTAPAVAGTLAGWRDRGTLFVTPTASAGLAVQALLSLDSERVAVLPLPLPPERVPAPAPEGGSDVLALAPVHLEALLGAIEVARLAGVSPRLVVADPSAGRAAEPGSVACAYDVMPGRAVAAVDDWRAAVSAGGAGAIVLGGIGTGPGWTLREALATGRPVVAPSLPVVRDHLSAIGADAYLYVSPFDSRRIAQALVAALRRDRGAALESGAREAVVSESYADAARTLLGLFERAVGGTGPRAPAAPAGAGESPVPGGPRVEVDERLSVCVLNPNPSGGGGERFMRQLVGGMAGHASRPRMTLVCQVDLNAAFDPGTEAMRCAGVEVHMVSGPEFTAAAEREMARSDVAYYSWPHQSEPPVTSVPLTCTFHDLNWKHFDVIGQADKARLEVQTPRWLERAAAFVHSSQFIREELHRYYDVPRSFTHVIPIATDPPPVAPTAAELERARRRFGLPQRFLLSPNGFHLHKNYPALSEALRILRRDGRPVPVIASGAATERYHGPDLIGLGYISAGELQAIYELCAGVVQTTLYEAGSFPMAEAMIARKPVAISRIPPIVEQVERTGVVAELFDPLDPDDVAEAIWRIWDGSEATAAETIAANAAAVAARTWDDVAGDYLALLGSLAAR